MRKTLILTLVAVLLITVLSSCSLFGSNEPATLEEYMRLNFTNPDETSASMAEKITAGFRLWKRETGSYVSPNGARVTVSDYNITVQTHSGNMFIINTKKSASHVATYADPATGERVFLYADNSREYLETPSAPAPVYLNVTEYPDGYLFVLDEPLLVFLSKDKQDVYLSEDGSAKFTFYGDKTYTLTDTSVIDTVDKNSFYRMPAESFPDFGNTLKLAFMKIGIKSDEVFYEAYLPYVKPTDAVEKLQEAGYRLYQTDLYGVYADGEQDVVYEGTDADTTLAVKVSLAPVIQGLKDDPENFGTKIVIMDYRYRSAYDQISLNSHSDWTSNQANALQKIGVPLPYTQFGYLLTVSSEKGSWDGHSKGRLGLVDAYLIKDEYYRPLLGDYEALLLDCGFTKHVPAVSADSTREQVEAWNETADAVYYNCYVSEQYGVAVKIGWDVLNGNKIFIYTLDDLRAVADGTYFDEAN